MRRVCETVERVLAVEYCSILELLSDNRFLLREGVGWREGLVGRATEGTGLLSQAGYTLLRRDPVVVDDLREEKRFRGEALLREHGVSSSITLPVQSGKDTPFGVLGAHTATERAFTEGEIRFLTDVSEILGRAVKQKAIEERAEAAESRFDVLANANSLLCSSPDYDTVLSSATWIALDALADWCFVDVVTSDGQSGYLPGRDIYRVAVANGPGNASGEEALREARFNYRAEAGAKHATPAILRTGQSERVSPVDDALLEEVVRDSGHLGLLRDMAPSAYMCVPLQVRRHLVGSMGFLLTEYEGGYSREDLTLAEGLARCTALAIDNSPRPSGGNAFEEPVARSIHREKNVLPSPSSGRVPSLTPRLLEVLELMSAGKTAREIGVEFSISENTVRQHIRKIREAFGVGRQWHAVTRAWELGLIPYPSVRSRSASTDGIEE